MYHVVDVMSWVTLAVEYMLSGSELHSESNVTGTWIVATKLSTPFASKQATGAMLIALNWDCDTIVPVVLAFRAVTR